MDKTPPKSPAARDGDRIAKVLARSGVASRRDAEKLIAEGRVAVNGKIIDSPALNVTARDKVTVDGQPMAAPEAARLWLYYKPEGLVTTARDEKGRQTVFDTLPEDMPRVMSVGRLDLNSEGLLLLTNDGDLKRRLELPATGWLRKYRVRIKGNPSTEALEPLRQGITVDSERFQAMEVTLDRHQGANAWLTIGLRQGRNREIRRALMTLGIEVNRLIRVSYGPFRLNTMKPGEVLEVKARVLRDQLGMEGAAALTEAEPARRPSRGTAARAGDAGADGAARGAGRGAGTRGGAPMGGGAGGKAPARTATGKGTGPKVPGPAAGKPAAAGARRGPQPADTADPAAPVRRGAKPQKRHGDGSPPAPARSPSGKPKGTAGKGDRTSPGPRQDAGRPARPGSGKPAPRGGPAGGGTKPRRP